LRIKAILATMSKDKLAPEENFDQLRQELSVHYRDDAFLMRKSMGGLVRQSLLRIYDSTRV
ncbi:MAG: hypothetical protein MKZ70_08955, partial [Opitutales bacterium]|nr:hypothetical protein [Opitutales bacterium]